MLQKCVFIALLVCIHPDFPQSFKVFAYEVLLFLHILNRFIFVVLLIVNHAVLVLGPWRTICHKLSAAG